MFLLLSNWHSGICISLLEVWLVWVNHHIYDQLWILTDTVIFLDLQVWEQSQDPYWLHQGTVDLLGNQPFPKTSLPLILRRPSSNQNIFSCCSFEITSTSLIIIVISSLLVLVKKYHPNLNTLLQTQSEQHRVYHLHWTLFLSECALNTNWLFHQLLYL